MYEKELKALKKAGRFRERKLFSNQLVDFASNDYLGLASHKEQLDKALAIVNEYESFAPKASMLVNGYHEMHARFEALLCSLQGFEDAITVGSGFLANLSLLEALVRKHDVLYIDEHYHASGVMATKMLQGSVVVFHHNDAEDLREKLTKQSKGRCIIAIEGVYSMDGQLCNKDIFEVADTYEAILIVDEAHSSGVVGKNLLGVFEHYGITPQTNHIKMGTLGKAYGSYGAYILASKEVVRFLENRAKPIIYSTAPSVIDTTLAYVNIKYINKKAYKYRAKIDKRQEIVTELLGVEMQSLILPIPCKSNQEALEIQEQLAKEGYLVGAIRQPTVAKPIVRITLRSTSSKKLVRKLLNKIDKGSEG